MTLPLDYLERVYAGVLGKIIGVYLGRPFEGWTYDQIIQNLGEINYYVHDKRNVPLVVTDDDISGTFTFLRALPDHGNSLDLTPEEISKTWLNYLIEEKTILWWGGLGNSTEHTAYLRLKSGIPAPQSGSITLNGPIVAQQIGSQIFIDGWAMVSPADPERAADLARRAASVSHDGEAIYGAQCLAAMESQAFVEQNIDRLIDMGQSVIPHDSIIYGMIDDLRSWYAKDNDWRKTFQRIQDQYGYKDYIGGCHMVPNHALIILGLLYGEGDFQKSLMVCNTCGWDTDCNSGNLGCLIGIRNGLSAFEGADWRGPVADRMYLPTMDGGRCITDAVTEAFHIANAGRALVNLPHKKPKANARFHFEMPGSVQGFQATTNNVQIENIAGHSGTGKRSLRLTLRPSVEAARVTTATFILPEEMNMPSYELIASPTLYPGQVVRASVSADGQNDQPIEARLALNFYNAEEQPTEACGPAKMLPPGETAELTWTVPDLTGRPIYSVGLELGPSQGSVLYLDYLTWEGVPATVFDRPSRSQGPVAKSSVWQKAWVNAIDQWPSWSREPFKLIQNQGRGMITTGARDWQDYRLSTVLRPALVKSGGLAVRVQGLLRFYALQITDRKTICLLRAYDSQETILAEAPLDWQLWESLNVSLEVKGSYLRAWVEGQQVFDLDDPGTPLAEGAVGLVVEEGHMMAEAVSIEPA